MNKVLNLDKKIPKYFEVMIEFVTDEKKTFKCASWRYMNDFIEYITTDNEVVQIFYNNIKVVHYDKKFTRIIEEVSKTKSKEEKK